MNYRRGHRSRIMKTALPNNAFLVRLVTYGVLNLQLFLFAEKRDTVNIFHTSYVVLSKPTVVEKDILFFAKHVIFGTEKRKIAVFNDCRFARYTNYNCKVLLEIK